MKFNYIIPTLVLFSIGMIIALILQFRREEQLGDSVKTYGILVWIDRHQTKASGARVKYIVNGKWVYRPIRCDCREMKLGDTVLIQYARKNHTLVEMIDQYPDSIPIKYLQ